MLKLSWKLGWDVTIIKNVNTLKWGEDPMGMLGTTMVCNGVVEVEAIYCDDCGVVGCEGGGKCGDFSWCFINAKGEVEHEMVRCVSGGVYYAKWF